VSTASSHMSYARVDKVIGARVKDQSGRKVGRIEDLVIDHESSDIVFAVVGFGCRGRPETYFPIPWQSLSYDHEGRAYVGTFTRAQLEAAPAGWEVF
jgi:sporulation protein YlmC with PRC-barrel domain